MDREELKYYMSAPSHKHTPHHVRAIIVVGLLALGLGYGAFFSFVQGHNVTAEVTEFTWQRSIVQQVYGTRIHQGWNIPASGGMLSKSWQYHYTMFIPVSTGKITVFMSVPVYDWYYTYQIDEWYDLGTVKASGTDQHPYWPQIMTDRTHRGVSYHESYTAVFHTSKKDYHYSLSESEWNSLRLGATVTLKMNRIGRVLAYKINTD